MDSAIISSNAPERRLAIVVLTRNRRNAVLATLARLTALERPFPICVVDNGSNDGTADAIAKKFADVQVVRLPRNMGAAGRNFGVREVGTHYVAFCDDDAWWANGALTRAITIMDDFPKLGALSARVLSTSREEREDPESIAMAKSTLRNSCAIPGTEVAGFIAGACVMRRSAFLAAGAYEPRLFPGGEEDLLAMDMQAKGWRLGYVPELVVRHHPSFADDAHRRRLLLRNALWCAWLRRPASGVWRETVHQLNRIVKNPSLAPGLIDALRGAAWVWKQRRVVPLEVERKLRQMETCRMP